MIQWETLRSAAARTGFALATFRRWSSEGKLPFPVYGPATDFRVRPEEVDDWLLSTKRKPLTFVK